jgi:diguanylate cyclase (GGDEF)-like protein
MRIMIAEDSQTQCVDLRRRLEAMGHEVAATYNGLQAWNQLRARPEPVLISDWLMPEMNGLDLCRKIRAEIKSPYIYVILLTAKTHRHERLQGLNAGADDFLPKPVDSIELEIALKTAQRIIAAQEALQLKARELERTNQELVRLASRDELTGFRNHRGFQDELAAAVERASNAGLPISLIRVELDHLERIVGLLEPASYQQFVGRVADRIREHCRDCDIPARAGEHGFAVILPGLSLEGSLPFADLVRCSLAETTGGSVPVSASVGVACLEPGSPSADATQFLDRCESALTAASHQGGNRVVVDRKSAGPSTLAGI